MAAPAHAVNSMSGFGWGVWNFGKYYSHPLIDQYCSKATTRLSPATWLFTAPSNPEDRKTHVLKSAQYLQRELPIRLAHRVSAFRGLPFIVAINQHFCAVIEDVSGQMRFVELLDELVADHGDGVLHLAQGFRECRSLIRTHGLDRHALHKFLDHMISARLGMRLLAENLFALSAETSRPGHVGIINTEFSPCRLIETRAEYIRRMVQMKYGAAPEVEVRGDAAAVFPYIAEPLEYVLGELLKNAMRATVEHHLPRPEARTPDAPLPPVVASVHLNDREFYIRISDLGGGVSPHAARHIWDYGFSTYDEEKATTGATSAPRTGLEHEAAENEPYPPWKQQAVNASTDERAKGSTDEAFATANKCSAFGIMTSSERVTGTVAGYGFGLPMARTFVDFLGGSMQLASTHSSKRPRRREDWHTTGTTDVYLRLPLIHNPQHESFRI